MLAVMLALVAGSALIDLTFDWYVERAYDDDRYLDMHGTCYWAGDVRNYMRISLDGYTDYSPALNNQHLVRLNDRSWWPLFPVVTGQVIRHGGGPCSSRTVNAFSYLALVPLFHLVTGERRWWRLLILALIPYGAWMYVGQADTFFLALSLLLVWMIHLGDRYPRAAGIGALAAGVLVGLAKANSLTLVPPLGVWALSRTSGHMAARGARNPRQSRWWRRPWQLIDDANPGWTPAMGALGITLANVWWIYQSSGYYPYYVLMVQRTLWYREFVPWNLGSMTRIYTTTLDYIRMDFFTMLQLQRVIELSALVFALALMLSQLPPRWPGGELIPIPFHWRVAVFSVLMLTISSGQAHGLERYLMTNVFLLLTYHRLLFGQPGQSVSWRVWTFPGFLRWTLLLLMPLQWGMTYLLLGWNPLEN
jgi:hypothetical protein